MTSNWTHTGVMAALGAAVLFGTGVPLAKLLLDAMSPWLLAGLLYLGSGVGLAILRLGRHSAPVRLMGSDAGWLTGAVVSGGVIGPVLLMWGLSETSGSTASLLLNAEGVLTALIAWFVFRENFDRRIVLGMLCIVAGAVVLSWPQRPSPTGGDGSVLPALAISGACLAWAIDNNFTRKVALADATYIAMVKGFAAGSTNVAIAFAAGATMPAAALGIAAGVLGFISYGMSLVLFVVALRNLGTARTAGYFSIAPFAGAVISVLLLAEPLSVPLVLAGSLMGIGVWIHVTERHVHVHTHEELEHEHAHEHDAHHQHEHDEPIAPGVRHRHRHRHARVTHTHAHYPDAHHRHRH
jgi:drug/metabolite transporter (DMT)-like permease